MFALVLALSLGDSSSPPSATAYYVAALHATREARQPAFARYRTDVASTGMKFSLVPTNGVLGFAIGYGPEMESVATLDASYDRAQDRVMATLGGASSIVRMPLLNPTWTGIADWMHYGFFGPTESETTPPPTPFATSRPDTLRTIAEVTSVNPGAYKISDGGSVACESGAPGHRLLLAALSDAATHPLTSVVVDAASMRFCTMDFRYGAGSALKFTGSFELHLAAESEYWLVKGGTADFYVRAMGITAKHTHIAFTNSQFAFPTTL